MKKSLIILFTILALSLALFGNGIKGDFVFDDKIVVVGHPLIDGSFPNFIKIFSDSYHSYQPKTGLYRPLPILSYALNAWIFGTSPVSFHIVNIILHTLVVFLLFIVARQRFGEGIAYIASALFLFLPIHVEDVTSIVGRAELLALLFILAGLWAMRAKHIIAAPVFFFLGILSKESAIAFLPIVAFEEYFSNGVSPKKLLYKLSAFLPPLLFYPGMRYAALGEYFLSNDATAVYNPLKFSSFFTTLWTSGKILLIYLQKTFFPTWFSIDYSFNQIPLVNNPFLSVPAILGLLSAMAIIFIAIWKRSSVLGWGAAFFLFSYFIVSNLVFKTGTIMAERLFYAPSVGLCIIVAFALHKIFSRDIRFRYASIAIFSVLLIFYSYKIIMRNRNWLSEDKLFASAYAYSPDSVVNRTNRSYLLYMDKKYDESRREAESVLTIVPDHVPALNLAAQSSKKLGDKKLAEDYWKRAIEIRNDYVRAYLGLGVLYYENGYFDSAEAALTDAVNIFPRWTEVLYLSLAKTALGKYDEAVSTIVKNFNENPVEPELNFALGTAYYKWGKKDQAMIYLNKVQSPNMMPEGFLSVVKNKKIFLIVDL